MNKSCEKDSYTFIAAKIKPMSFVLLLNKAFSFFFSFTVN